MFIRIIIVSVILLLQGCCPSAQFITNPYNVVSQENEAKIIVMRKNEFMGSACTIPVKIDKTLVAHLGVGDYVELSVPIGEHFIVVGPDFNLSTKLIKASQGKIYYFHWGTNSMSSEKSMSLFKNLSEEEGKIELTKNKYNKLSLN